MSTGAQRNGWELYQFPPSLVLGFHGCDSSIGEAILRGEKDHLIASTEDYHWLGKGIYFWDSNPQRALEWAEERARGHHGAGRTLETPFVLGAVINMGHCLNLTDSSALYEVENAYQDLAYTLEQEGRAMPVNSAGNKVRRLDCAVFEYLHERRAETGLLTPYQTVRGTYHEGKALFPGTDLSHQDHTQICVRDQSCILGYFRPIRVE